jgi:hypothetical protein
VVLAIALVVGAGFLVQGLVIYFHPVWQRRSNARPRPVLSALPPEFIALEAQFFLAPTRALAEARDLLGTIGAPNDVFANVVDLASFTRALRQAHACLTHDSAGVARQSRMATSK